MLELGDPQWNMMTGVKIIKSGTMFGSVTLCSLTIRMLQATHNQVLQAINKVLVTKIPSLKRAWESAYGSALEMQLDSESLVEAHNRQIVDNVVDFYHDLPANSTVRSSLVCQLFQNIPVDSVASYLGVNNSSVHRSRGVAAKPLTYYLINLGIPRDRLGESEDYAIAWCELLQEPSGKLRKCYFGLFKSMYAEYYAWCVKENHPYVSPEILQRIRRERRIWILKGDIFQVCALSFGFSILTVRTRY